jgi:hypothetical protein
MIEIAQHERVLTGMYLNSELKKRSILFVFQINTALTIVTAWHALWRVVGCHI